MSLHLGNNQRRAYPYKQTHIILKIAVHYTHKTQTYRGGEGDSNAKILRDFAIITTKIR